MAHRAVAAFAGLLVWFLGAATFAQSAGYPPVPKVSTVRLYVIDCGTIITDRPEGSNLTREEVGNPNHMDPCFLVMHPKGMLLFDAGLPDAIVGRPIYENIMGASAQLKFTTLKGELANIGVNASMITYFAISHSHWDHVGNANDYAGSTWLARKAEYDFMFGPSAGGTTRRNAPADPAPVINPNATAPGISVYDIGRKNYAGLAQARTQFIEGDYDVFGDGSVVLLETPGHTPGHQCLYVKLARSGGVVISGDLYHYIQERTLGRTPAREEKTGTPASRKKIEDFLVRTNSQLWIGHAIEWYRDAVKSPGWYE